ncbi:M20 family metallopeptidase [Microvirga thermotolerans]|uniref:M20/M25/M40 family metallo-hydrolase n=1 Tax=Microvirga thermotolerans TaxID=2651334 RepID=A0A5P9JWC2_9HYPH|nr:M20 family metallopeptidase [Microvirga thermotolerans]QFU16733.1 M20/M25/M40 family metallo-hydrolase [Microvirga thermotolerans]
MTSAALDTLITWVRTESPTHDAAGVNLMMDLVVAQMADAPVAVERIPGEQGLGDALVLRAGPQRDEPAILVMSHLDTVHPLGTIERDLPLKVDGDRLYGPGIYDMKGGAYFALEAFKDVARRGSAARPVVFIVTPDEEIGSPMTRPVIEDVGRRSAYALVTEPARDGGRIVTSRKGVGRFDVHVEGRPAHAGSRHKDGRNAIYEAARQILAVEALTDYGRGITTTVGMVSGGTAVNTVPQHCRFPVDLRVETVADGEAMTKALLGLKPSHPDFRVTVTGGMNRPPYERSEGTSRLFDHARALAAEIGFDLVTCDKVGGGSDGNFTAALGIPTLDGLGIDGDGAHTLQEYGLISSIAPRQKLMTRLLETLR